MVWTWEWKFGEVISEVGDRRWEKRRSQSGADAVAMSGGDRHSGVAAAAVGG